MKDRMLVFDMDGVLVDVMESYYGATIETVRQFTGREITKDQIQEYKNRGGWNNDWELTREFCRQFGVTLDYATVVERYNAVFLGKNNDGMILRERWLPRPGLLQGLAARFGLAIFTGRIALEVAPTLGRFADGLRFDPVVTADRVAAAKPAPDGLLEIRRLTGAREMFYVGDTVDDAKSAAAAQVPFVGIAALDNPRHAELARLLEEHGAFAVLDDINQLEGALPR